MWNFLSASVPQVPQNEFSTLFMTHTGTVWRVFTEKWFSFTYQLKVGRRTRSRRPCRRLLLYPTPQRLERSNWLAEAAAAAWTAQDSCYWGAHRGWRWTAQIFRTNCQRSPAKSRRRWWRSSSQPRTRRTCHLQAVGSRQKLPQRCP